MNESSVFLFSGRKESETGLFCMLVKKSMAANASTGIVNCRLGVCQDLLLVNVFIEAIFF